MILAIDVGNTNIVLGCIEDGKILNIVRAHTDANRTDAEHAIQLKQLLNFFNHDPHSFEGAILSSVVPPITGPLIAAVKYVTGLNCMVVGPGIKTGLNLRVDDPGTVAGDLVVGGVAAIACYGAPAIVMDFGTATTVTVIDKDSCFRGGAIVGTAAAIDGMIERMEAELGYPCLHIATGGLAQCIVTSCRNEIVCDDDLLLKGLWALWEKNKNTF